MAPPLADLPFEELAFQLAGAKSRTAALSDELHELRQQLREVRARRARARRSAGCRAMSQGACVRVRGGVRGGEGA